MWQNQNDDDDTKKAVAFLSDGRFLNFKISYVTESRIQIIIFILKQNKNILTGSNSKGIFSFLLLPVVPTELPGASTGWLGWMGTFLAVTVAAIIVIFLLVSLMVCCCCKRKGRGMPVGRGQADGRGAVSTSVPSSSSSSNSSSNSSPNYGEMSVRTPPREVYQPTVIDNMSGAGGSHVFYGYPPPSGRADLGGGIYGFQGGYFPMRKENLCHTVDRGFNNGHNY